MKPKLDPELQEMTIGLTREQLLRMAAKLARWADELRGVEPEGFKLRLDGNIDPAKN